MLTTKQFNNAIQTGKYDDLFAGLYGDTEREISTQRNRYSKAVEEFEKRFGKGRQISVYSTPGRTEIGGNHTDHNNGIVMAAAVNLDIIAIVSVNDTGIIRVDSSGFSAIGDVDLARLVPLKEEVGTSASLIRGIAASIQQRGGQIGGFDAYTTSDVLPGSGLSSSAAFEVCIASILNIEYNDGKFTPLELGMIGQHAENEFFGKPSGLMDQTACAVGGAIMIDFKKPGDPYVEQIPFDLNAYDFRLIITDTKGSHANLTDEYTAIRREMEEVAEYFGKKVLREVEPTDFYQNISKIRNQTGDRAILRANHFYEECRRAQGLAGAIQNGDFNSFLELVKEGGHSSFEYNQNAYSIQNPNEQGVSLGLALSQKVLSRCGAWRLQGGGFAGTIQAFVPNNLVETYCNTLESVFGKGACHLLTVRKEGAIRVKL